MKLFFASLDLNKVKNIPRLEASINKIIDFNRCKEKVVYIISINLD